MTECNALSQFIIARLRTIRKEKGISQEKLSIEAGLESRYINKLENGNLNPTLKTLDKILWALGVDYKVLFDIDNSLGSSDLLPLLTALLDISKDDRKAVLEAILTLLTYSK